MTMKLFVRMALGALMTWALAAGAQAASTKQEAQALVEKAAEFANRSGTDLLVAEVNEKNGPFHRGELYVFVYDLDGTLIADPVNKNLVGQNNLGKPDVSGKLFRKEIVEVAKKQGTGWVEYQFTNPVSGKVEPKSSFVKKLGDIIIIAGAYH